MQMKPEGRQKEENNKIESTYIIVEINSQNWFLKGINTTENPLARLTKKKRRNNDNYHK